MYIVIYIPILKQTSQDKSLAYIHLSTLSKNDRSGGFHTTPDYNYYLVLGKAWKSGLTIRWFLSAWNQRKDVIDGLVRPSYLQKILDAITTNAETIPFRILYQIPFPFVSFKSSVISWGCTVSANRCCWITKHSKVY